MRPPKLLPALTLAGLALAACDDDEGPQTTTFTVAVQDLSAPGTLTTDRAGGAVPLSPGAYAVFSGSTNPIFVSGAPADEGTELIAEDGFPETKVTALAGLGLVASGMFDSPGGGDAGPAIFPGETATVTVAASAGDRLQLITMFVQSNDWFYAFSDGGLALFDGNEPVSGDVTAQLALYDAGTEEDTAPGTGPDQKPVQDPAATNVGPEDDDPAIRLASTDGFPIPAAASVIRVTITPEQ